MRRALPFLLLLAPAAAAEEALVDYVVEDAAAIPAALAPPAGGPDIAAALFESAGCAGCHGAGKGPDLSDIGARLTEGEIRLMIVEPRIVYPETEMPAYYTPGRFGEAPDELVGRTRLSAGEIEALVAWLAAPKGG